MCEEENSPLNDGEGTEILPPAEADDNTILTNITGDRFRGKQINDPSLKGLFDKAGEKNSEFQVDKGVLFRIVPDKKEGIRKQLVITEELREKILKLCHNESGRHVENARDWEKNLPAALLGLRTVDHDTTGFSPSELVHGRNLRTPERLLFEKWTEPEEENSLITEYVFELLNRFQKYKELAMEKASAEQIKRKTWYDKKAISREFKIGDQVLILATHKTNKFAVNWVGPGVMDQKLSVPFIL
ncbi:hypothetical protein AVEN_115319-1 [Araneus ventricosus]|uniref:Uncharacterized protein n=1 Tax=Araneus ventricosus TaxID=182803 RepID=A0A4Y1ZYA0_ARAVE|nr:hypothetical protein AVEN_115319-1 [Araneus ventricosus]